MIENLLFASRIKNTQKDFDHQENVYRVANLLGVQACLKLKTSRLSGGQYKRVSIAQELLSQPDILILDEPTSGLDSSTCYKTVSVLRELADMSRGGLLPPLAIVMTIHQPQIKIFNLFHHVYIMSSMGHSVYEGQPEYLIDTVADCCKLLPPTDDQNPASFIMDLASEVYGVEPIGKLVELQRENFLTIHYVPSNFDGNDIDDKIAFKSEFNRFNQLVLNCADLEDGPTIQNKNTTNGTAISCEHLGDDDGKLYVSEQLRKRNNHEHSFWLHTGLLIKRLWISMWRDSLLTTTRIAFHLIIPFVFYLVYSRKSGMANACPLVERELDIQDMVSDSNIQRLTIQHDELILTFENVSLFFLLLYSFSMCVLALTALSFPLNMQILLKETSNGWYTMPRFVMAKTLADLPIELTMPMISVSIAYALTGQPSSYLSWRMLSVTAVMTLCSLISQTQGLLFGAYFMNNVQAAVFISQASTLPWIMLSGFTTRISQLPRILQWLSFGSIYRLGIESIVAVRYGFGVCTCDEDLINDTPPRIVGIPDQLKSVMSYYMDMYNSSPNATQVPSQADTISDSASNGSSQQMDIFGKIASTLARANTYGADIATCDDVKPFIMSTREVDEKTLPMFLTILVIVLLALKILLFFVVKIRAG